MVLIWVQALQGPAKVCKGSIRIPNMSHQSSCRRTCNKIKNIGCMLRSIFNLQDQRILPENVIFEG